MSAAVEGYNTTIATSPDGVTYTSIAEVAKISIPSMDGKDIDVTHLLSPNGWGEWIPGIVQAGELKLDLNFTKAQFNTLFNSFRPVAPVPYIKITLPTGSTFVCQGFLKQLGMEIPKDDKISNTCGFRLSGKPVWTS